MPKRIQRKRTKGWSMPFDAVYVGRPTAWGNPYRVDGAMTAEEAVAAYRALVTQDSPEWKSFRKDVRHYLGGLDLACWCPLDQPCHADVLLELANQ